MIEIEIDDGRNGDLLFHPAGERLRGRFDPARVASEDIGTLVRDLPRGVPGQLVRFDPATGTGSLSDPLHEPANADIKAAVEKRLKATTPGAASVEYAPPVKEFPGAHAGTWLGWMRRAVVAGLARVTKGKLPDADPPDMRKGFYSPEPRADPKDALITQLVALLAAKMTPAERKELSGLLGTK